MLRMARILVVDDEDLVLSVVRHSLRGEGYEVFAAADGRSALSLARRHLPDLIILDINMPGLNGLEVCRRLRQDPALEATPILFVTGRIAVKDRVEGLDQGGDDYLPKPFDIGELTARVRALLRRAEHAGREGSEAEGAASVLVGRLRLDLRSRQATVGRSTMALTPTEFDLLHHLMTHPDEVFSTEELLQQVWGYHPGTGDTSLVRWHVRNLRAKIERDPAHPRFIKTVPRHGYTLVGAP